MDPETRNAIGQEEYDEISARESGQQQLKRFTEAVLRMAAVWGLEPFTSHGLDATKVADEDHYMTQVESRVTQLEMKCETLNEQCTENSNETSMTHDYVTGIHYAVVESGGFLRNGLGLTQDQWIHLNTLEPANMVAHCTMGSGDFMRLIRQRAGPPGSAEITTVDDPRAVHQQGEESESEEDDVEMEVEPDTTKSTGYQSLTDMMETLSREQRLCLDDGDVRDAAVIQNLMLEMLEEIHRRKFRS
eukprot:s689_g5.t1